jgi:hypothetical protein
MYFEPSKKTYYRFPSTNSIHEMDSKYYFPDKPYASGENIRQEAEADRHYERSDTFLVTK